MAGHIENGDKGGSGARRAVQPIIPVLPLRPVKKGAQLIPQQKPAQIKNGVSNGLLSGGFERPDHTIRIQLGELEGDHEQVAHSPALSNQTGSSMDAAPSPLPSGMFVPRQLSMLKAQKVLSDASNNDTLTQATSSRPSSTSPTFNLASVDPTSESKLQPPVVELPPDAYISRSASLKISFLYQEDLDSASSTITPHSRSPTISAFPEMSPAPIGAGNQSSTGGNTGANPQVPNLVHTCPANIPSIRPGLSPGAPMVSLSIHFALLFDLQLYCDQQIMVEVPGLSSPHPLFQSHKLVMLRSPLLAFLLHFNKISGNESSHIIIPWPIGYFDSNAFTCALRHLYNDEVLSIDQIENYTNLSQHITDWRKSQLMFTIVYWLSGLILQADAIANQAEAIAKGLINFDNIGMALKVVNDLCDHELFGGERAPTDTPTTHRYRNLQACPPSAPVPAPGPIIPDASTSIRRRQIHQIARTLGTRLNTLIFTFLATNITFQDFKLDLTLHQTIIPPLFPITPSLRAHYPTAPPPTLQTLQFGQFPPQAARLPSLKNRHTSYILLNLPFGNLKQAIRIMRAAAHDNHTAEDVHVRELVEKVIAEREVRREIVNRDPAVSEEEQRANMAVWRVLGYEERVVEKDEEGVGEWDVEASCSEEWAGRV